MNCFMPWLFEPGLSDPYPSSRLTPPHTPRPAPRATTRVCRTSIAELKNSMVVSSCTKKSLRPVGYTPEIVDFYKLPTAAGADLPVYPGPGVNKKSSRDGRIAVLFSRMTGFPHKRRQHSLLSPP